MKLSFKNIAIALGIAAGATAAAVITTKTVNKPKTLLAKKTDKKEGLKKPDADTAVIQEDDILYV